VAGTVLGAEDQAALDRVKRCQQEAQPAHDRFVSNSERRYARYRSYQELRHNWTASPKDRDMVVRSSKREFGDPLVVPIAFRAVETTVPRVLASDPRLNVRPGHPDFEGLETDVKVLLERQSRQMRLRLGLQDVCKSGAIYGIGGGKCFWKQEYREKRSLVELESGRFVTAKDGKANVQRKLVFDDPWFEAVDMFDCFWDPWAYSTETLRYFIHRTWRDDLYIRQMVERGVWRAKENDPECPWTLEDLLKGGAQSERQEVRDQRDRAAGAAATQAMGGQILGAQHQVLEFHDGDRVITVVDGAWPVQVGENPYWHRRIPFQFWRPRRVPHEFVGIGVIEPIEMLHDELMELRGSRRDNAQLALQRVFAYFDGLVDPADLKFGPGLAIPVNGDPRELLYPIEIPDIPNSGYQEEDRLLAELERASGLSDQDQRR
jgi:hypothetical protein